jgi:hypothetical protein
MGKGDISIKDFEKTSDFNPKKSSLMLLKEHRRMIAYQLVKKARIKNVHLAR